MASDPEKQRHLKVSTREAAAALHSDMEHIKELASRGNQSSDELRRLSVTLRRLLLEGDLQAVAAPRIGKLRILAIDHKATYVTNRRRRLIFFCGSGVATADLKFGRHEVWEHPNKNPAAWEQKIVLNPRDEDYTTLSLDNFLSQRVLCLHDQWANRRDAIKFVTNKASGAHSDTSSSIPVDILLSRLRRYGTYLRGHRFHFRVEPGEEHQIPGTDPLDFLYIRDRIDPVMVEILATATSLASSPDIDRLMTSIASELR